jgi:hypothetical protein
MASDVKDVVKDSGGAWKSEASFWSYVKGVLRRGWMRHPVKLEFIKANRIRIPSQQPKGIKEVWGMVCSCCNIAHPMREIQIDHCSGDTARLTKVEDIQFAAEHLLLVSFSDLSPLCKGCHGIVTLARDRGVTFEQAKIEKQVIEFSKLKAAQQIKVLQEYDSCGKMSATNAKARVALYRRIIEEGK